MLQLYNTLSRKPESFKPLHGNEVGLYTCGPTIYNTPHIGNWRSFLWEDILKRYLKFKGYHVHHIMNITDVDDKTIRASREQSVSLDALTQPYKKKFFDELKELNIEPADQYTEATQHIPSMVKLVQRLLEKGIAYRAEDGSVYYEIKKFRKYGQLSKFKIKKLKAGARVSQDEYEKQNVSDFALWKAWTPEDGNVYWETELGKGRPGWHIECSAMSMQYLGESFDIHTGGIDNMFPHHENEIAQSEGATGKPFVKYWLHGKHLLVNGQKMAKSLNNFYQLGDLKFGPKTIRFALVFGHYRKELDFRMEEVEKLDKKRKQLNETVQRLWEKTQDEKTGAIAAEKTVPKAKKTAEEFLKKFESAMDSDLNTPKAFAELFEFAKKTNQLLDNGTSPKDAGLLLEAFRKADSVFGILDFEPKKEEKLSLTIEQLIQKREELRKQKKWQEADQIRSQLAEQGIELMDKPDGTKWRKKEKKTD